MIDLIYGSIVLNAALSAGLIYYRRKLLKLKRRPDSIEVKEFLADLMNGGSVLHIKVINPGDLMLRSRR